MGSGKGSPEYFAAKVHMGTILFEMEGVSEEIAELKRRLHMGEVQNVRIIREKRKDLARVLTVLGEQLAKEAN